MDEEETINRREAVGGLTVLGALMMLLIGTIMYRIVNSGPAAVGQRPAPAIAADIDATGAAAAALAESTDAPGLDGEVRAASHGEVGRTGASTGEGPPQFIAPAER